VAKSPVLARRAGLPEQDLTPERLALGLAVLNEHRARVKAYANARVAAGQRTTVEQLRALRQEEDTP
jgi:hypothetical protein